MLFRYIRHSLNQPFPHNTSWQSRLKTALGFGLFISVFLLVFRPFELDTVSRFQLYRSCFIFGLVTFTCIFGSNTLLEYLFPDIFEEKKWTTGKQMLNVGSIILLVGLINYLVAPLLFEDVKLTGVNFFRYQGIALAVGVLPVIIYTLYVKNRWLHQFKLEASELQKKLDAKREAEKNTVVQQDLNNLLVFEGDNQKDKLSVAANKLIYAEAASNYVKVFYEQESTISYSIVRMTMKKAAEITDPYSNFFRCHRAFIVNLDKVQGIDGNAQGYKLNISGVDDKIPVSKNLNKEFADRVLAARKSKTIGNS